jgi:hypothetical protein
MNLLRLPFLAATFALLFALVSPAFVTHLTLPPDDTAVDQPAPVRRAPLPAAASSQH